MSMPNESSAALARVDAAIAAFDRVNGSVDDFVLLLLRRSELAGIPLSPEQIAAFLLISEDEALDIFARLSERGLLDRSSNMRVTIRRARRTVHDRPTPNRRSIPDSPSFSMM